MDEGNEISRHEVEVYRVLKRADGWLSNTDISARANRVAPRTTRATTLKLVRLGIVDQADVFPAHRFKLSAEAPQRNRGYLDRLHRAADALGISLDVS